MPALNHRRDRQAVRLSCRAILLLVLPFLYGAVGLPARAQQATVPATQQEQMYDPQPINNQPTNPGDKASLITRGRSVLIREGLRRLYTSDSGETRVEADTRQQYKLERGFNSLTIRPLDRDDKIILPPRDVIPDGEAGHGQRLIADAWLIQPTTRYDHATLGDNVEAGALRVVTTDGGIAVTRLTDGSVFEQLRPLVGDLDGDGYEEVVTVNSNTQKGSAVQVYRVGKDGNGRSTLDLAAEGPRMGRKNRWVNPVGIGDFNRDGRPELAVVETPDEGGDLVIYRLEPGHLAELARMPGFSNHAPGVPQDHVDLVRDITGDRRLDLVVPDATREYLRIVTMDKGKLVEIGKLRLPAKIKTDMLWVDEALTFGLEDNSVLSLSVFIQ